MRNYYVSFKFSKDGKSWSNGSATVKATSDQGAIMQIESKYPYVRDIKIVSVR